MTVDIHLSAVAERCRDYNFHSLKCCVGKAVSRRGEKRGANRNEGLKYGGGGASEDPIQFFPSS